MGSKKTSERKNYHHGDLRQAVLLAAVQLIQKRGDVSFTIRELATLTEVSHPAVYRHFANKKAVLAAVAEEGFQLLLEELQKAETHACKGPVEVLRAQCENYVVFAFDHIGHFRAMYHAELSDKRELPALARLYQETGDYLMKNFARGITSAVFRDERPETMALSFWSMVHGLVDLTLQGQLPLDRVRDRKTILRNASHMVDLVLNGLLRDRASQG